MPCWVVEGHCEYKHLLKKKKGNRKWMDGTLIFFNDLEL